MIRFQSRMFPISGGPVSTGRWSVNPWTSGTPVTWAPQTSGKWGHYTMTGCYFSQSNVISFILIVKLIIYLLTTVCPRRLHPSCVVICYMGFLGGEGVTEDIFFSSLSCQCPQLFYLLNIFTELTAPQLNTYFLPSA